MELDIISRFLGRFSYFSVRNSGDLVDRFLDGSFENGRKVSLRLFGSGLISESAASPNGGKFTNCQFGVS